MDLVDKNQKRDLREKPFKNENFGESFKYAFEGIQTAFKDERNFRSHSLTAVLVLIACLFLDLNQVEWLWILLVIFLVLVMELLNTSLENVVDLVAGNKYHPLAKKVKDTAAAAVLITAFFSVVVGLIILGPKLLALFNL